MRSECATRGGGEAFSPSRSPPRPLSLNLPIFPAPPHSPHHKGALYGTYEAFRYKVPGIYKNRYVGQTTLSSAAVVGLFLGAGSLLHCGRGGN